MRSTTYSTYDDRTTTTYSRSSSVYTMCAGSCIQRCVQVLAREKAKLLQTRRTYVLHVAEKPTNERARTTHARTFFFFFGFLTPPTSSPSALSSFLGFLGDDDELLDFLPFLRFSRLLPRRFSLARFRLSVRDLDRDLLLFFFLFLPFLLFFFLSWRGLLLLLVLVFQTTVYMRYKPNIRPRAPYYPAAPRLCCRSLHIP